MLWAMTEESTAKYTKAMDRAIERAYKADHAIANSRWTEALAQAQTATAWALIAQAAIAK